MEDYRTAAVVPVGVIGQAAARLPVRDGACRGIVHRTIRYHPDIITVRRIPLNSRTLAMSDQERFDADDSGRAVVVNLDDVLALGQSEGEARHRCGDAEAVVIDMSTVDHVSSATIAELLMLQRTLRGIDVRLMIAGASSQIRQVFEMVKLDKLLAFCESTEAALRSLDDG